MPGFPYHVTHRGNRREAIFFDDEDREVYLAMVQEYAQRYGLSLWAYCLMTNHVHFVVVPQGEDSMALAVGRAHMRYARWLNRKGGWSGHLWANRYFSTVLDDAHLWSAVRYVEANPLRARMVQRAEEHAWSSCRVHAGICVDNRMLADERPFPGDVGAQGWTTWINGAMPEPEIRLLQRNTSTGRPTGSEAFIEAMEHHLDRILKRQSPGPKPKANVDTMTGDMFEGIL